jgi:hypothetical protein
MLAVPPCPNLVGLAFDDSRRHHQALDRRSAVNCGIHAELFHALKLGCINLVQVRKRPAEATLPGVANGPSRFSKRTGTDLTQLYSARQG